MTTRQFRRNRVSAQKQHFIVAFTSTFQLNPSTEENIVIVHSPTEEDTTRGQCQRAPPMLVLTRAQILGNNKSSATANNPEIDFPEELSALS